MHISEKLAAKMMWSDLATHFETNHQTLTCPRLAVKPLRTLAFPRRKAQSGCITQCGLLEQTRGISLHDPDILGRPVMTDSEFDDDTSFPPQPQGPFRVMQSWTEKRFLVRHRGSGNKGVDGTGERCHGNSPSPCRAGGQNQKRRVSNTRLLLSTYFLPAFSK